MSRTVQITCEFFFSHFQMSMSVPSTMVDVNRSAITPLGASSVPVTQGTSWMKME